MRRPRSFPLVLALALALFAPPAVSPAVVGAGNTAAPAPVDPGISQMFKDLKSHLKGRPLRKLDDDRKELLGLLNQAKKAYKKGGPCASARRLKKFLKNAQQLREGSLTKIAEGLVNLGRGILLELVDPANGARCADPRVGMDPRVTLLSSDNTQLQATVAFGRALSSTLQEKGKSWTQLEVPGLENGSGDPGTPAIPVWGAVVGVPRGAEVALTKADPSGKEKLEINLAPFQPTRDEFDTSIDSFPVDQVPPDQLYEPQPFEFSKPAYKLKKYPAQPCQVGLLGEARDLSIAHLECAAGQYLPRQDRMVLYHTITFGVAFTGGTGAFATKASFEPYEQATQITIDALMNKDVIPNYVDQGIPLPICAGEELLILTHPDYRREADILADWKETGKGIPTSVFEVNDGPDPGPDTNVQIDAFIEQRYQQCDIRPSYVLLLGDVEDIPSFVLPRISKVEGTTVLTDYPYSCRPGQCTGQTFLYRCEVGDPPMPAMCNGETFPFARSVLPSFAVGRVSVSSDTEADVVVAKIIGYEDTPPTGPSSVPFYKTVGMAGYFECCRTPGSGVLEGTEDGRSFTGKAERWRKYFIDHGYDVQRIYNTDTGHHPDYGGDPTPTYFSNGNPLPSPLSPADGFPWDGDAADITAGWNEGRFIMFNSDHGWSGGWADPGFSTGNIPSLTNGGLLPVVFSMNCSNAEFDKPASFSEAVLRHPGGGAVAAFGFSRMSNTAYFGFADGVLDAAWPDILPSFGGPTPRYRVGDMWLHGDIYMFLSKTNASLASANFLNTVNHLRIWHLIGDPTLEMRTGPPA